MRKCKHCKGEYVPLLPMQTVCGWECAQALAEKKREKEKLEAAKIERAADRAKKESLKNRAQWMREAQTAWNGYVRMRDYGKPCASCGAKPEQKYGGTMDCSHYRSVGAAPHLRFHLHNAASACVKCNRYLGGNVVALRAGLIERIGTDKIEAIDANNEIRKFDIEYLKRIKKIFTRKMLSKQKRVTLEII